MMFMLGMALVSGFASVPGVRYSAVPQEVWFLPYACLTPTSGLGVGQENVCGAMGYHGSYG